MRTSSSIVALPLTLLLGTVAHAQAVDGTLDGTFGGGQNVIAFDRGGTNRDFARALVVDGSRRIYLVGDVDSASGRKIGIVRLLPDGAADDTYGPDMNARVVAPPGTTAITVTSAALDAQGHLLVAGSSVVNGQDTSFLVCRFNPDGALAAFEGSASACSTPDFNLGGFNTDVANSILVQPDGKIVLAGYAATNTGTTLAVARLLADGSADPDFGVAGKATYTGGTFASFAASTIHRLADGSFVTAGDAYDVNALRFGMLVHIGSDGQVDTSFSGNHGYARSPSSNISFSDVAYDPAWKQFIAVGNHYQTQTTRPHVACYGPIGQLQVCLNGASSTYDFAIGTRFSVSSVLFQPDGRLLVAGTMKLTDAADAEAAVLRVDRGMQADTLEFAAPFGYASHDFGLAGHHDEGLALALQGSRVLVAGSALRTQNTNNYDFGIVAFALDRIFQNGFDR